MPLRLPGSLALVEPPPGLFSAEVLEGRGVNAHVRTLAATAWRLGEDEQFRKLALQRWAHTLGFRGYWMTKSRRYSTTLTALRRARVDWVAGREESDIPGSDDVVEIAEWRFAGVGYKTGGIVGWLIRPGHGPENDYEWPGRSCRRPRSQRQDRGSSAHQQQPRRNTMEKLLLTPEEAAEVIGVGRSKVYELMRDGIIDSVRIGGCHRILTAAIAVPRAGSC